MNIICAADNKYLPYCGIMLTSLFECNKDVKFAVTILQPEATTESSVLSKIEKLALHYGANIQLKEVTEKCYLLNYAILVKILSVLYPKLHIFV